MACHVIIFSCAGSASVLDCEVGRVGLSTEEGEG